MFRSITICLRAGRQGLYTDTCTLRRLARNKQISPHIRNLTITVSPKSPPPSSDSAETLKLIVWAMSMILPTYLEELPNLKSLRVDSEEFLRHCDDHIANELRHEFDSILRSNLSANPSLPFTSTLQSLQLNLAAAEDFHLLWEGDKPTFIPLLKNLQHLGLRVYDRSGPDGQRYYYGTLSAIQKKHPNTMYQRSLVPLIPRFPESTMLQTLQIQCTHVFDLDGFTSHSRNSGSCGLRELKLARVKVRAQTLIKCLLGSRELETLDLDDVQLKAGTWSQVFYALFPDEEDDCETRMGHHLTHLKIASVGYSPKSPFYSPSMSMPDDPHPIPVEGRHPEDLNALHRLRIEIVDVNRKRLGVVDDVKALAS